MGVRLTFMALVLAAMALWPSVASADYQPPPIRHVWVIVLENSSFNAPNASPFNTSGYSPYVSNVLTKQGNLLTQYWGTGHNSQSNYIAMASGQSPTPGTQSDGIFCAAGPFAGGASDEIPAEAPIDSHGQIVGQGCTYPAKVKTLADQLEAKGLTWKGYMQDLQPKTTGRGCASADSGTYVAKHDPFQWFHSIIDDRSRCLSHDVSLWDLAGDLRSVRTTPNFSFIAPDLFDDGHDGNWTANADTWLRQYVPMIMSSPAYRQDGMLLITFDESDTFIGTGAPLQSPTEDDAACCNEIPGPNSPAPGIEGPGGGRTGALVLSPFVKPGTVDNPADNPLHTGPGFYNHYSFLRSMEDLFGIDSGGDDGHGHLGFAGSYGPEYPGPGAFGPDVYNGWDGSPAKPASSASQGPIGPRAADGTATWQNPLPQGNDLNGVSCANESSCVAVGDGGTIAASRDGGETWLPRNSGTEADLNAVSCADASHCVAVGDAGTALATADGGASWSSRPSGTDAALNGVSCASASLCVAVGGGGAILRSGDGGQSWAAEGSGTSEPLYGVSCPAETTCFAVGPSDTIVRTTDGSSWSAKTVGGRVRTVSCASASSCVAAGDSGALLRTTDGGASWSGGGQVETYDSFYAPLRHRGVACPSANACFLVGEGGPHPDIAAIYATTNANSFSVGWKRQQSHSSNLLRAVSCPSASTCVAVGMRGSILRTTDGGAGWSSRSAGTDGDLSRIVCTQGFQHECLKEGINAVRGVSFPDANSGFAVGSYRTVMATGDGGAHWTTQTSGTPQYSSGGAVPPPGLNSIACASASTCVAVGDSGSVITTADGGASWSDQPSGTQSDLLGVNCPTGSTCLAVGSGGAILRTTDSGASWTEQSSGTAGLLSAVNCASAADCVAVGNFGTVLTTSDGGDTWSPGASGTTAYLDAVDCPSTSECLAVGEGGTVLRSTDGGQSWSAQDSGIGDDLMSVSCFSADRCMASGSAGTAITTADGGLTWTVHGTGTARALRAAAMPTAKRGFVAGDAAAILSVSTNRPPSAAFAFQPGAPLTGETVSFDASASADPDGQIARYEWDLDGDGRFETDGGSSPQATHSYAKSGNYTVSLRVTDDDGATDVVSHQVTVANRPPVAAFSFSPAFPKHRKPVSFDASASADPDGQVVRYEWDLDGNGSFETDSGSNPKVTHTYAKKGTYTVSLRVTDDEGATGRVSHDVVVK